eukprot:TRINITY_DN6259_c0_g1_i4.p1 TRINITY_DN6259_c0_g1~~TRINITY_DN6259_c0_g1_i4.p1  ORF type:complete len:688 (-),score=99.68 TRINITY_DN6259_c0_g1_i4:34-2097(-)
MSQLTMSYQMSMNHPQESRNTDEQTLNSEVEHFSSKKGLDQRKAYQYHIVKKMIEDHRNKKRIESVSKNAAPNTSQGDKSPQKKPPLPPCSNKKSIPPCPSPKPATEKSVQSSIARQLNDLHWKSNDSGEAVELYPDSHKISIASIERTPKSSLMRGSSLLGQVDFKLNTRPMSQQTNDIDQSLKFNIYSKNNTQEISIPSHPTEVFDCSKIEEEYLYKNKVSEENRINMQTLNSRLKSQKMMKEINKIIGPNTVLAERQMNRQTNPKKEKLSSQLAKRLQGRRVQQGGQNFTFDQSIHNKTPNAVHSFQQQHIHSISSIKREECETLVSPKVVHLKINHSKQDLKAQIIAEPSGGIQAKTALTPNPNHSEDILGKIQRNLAKVQSELSLNAPKDHKREKARRATPGKSQSKASFESLCNSLKKRQDMVSTDQKGQLTLKEKEVYDLEMSRIGTSKRLSRNHQSYVSLLRKEEPKPKNSIGNYLKSKRSASPDGLAKDLLHMDIIERNNLWLEAKNHCREQERAMSANKDLEGCSFKPKFISRVLSNRSLVSEYINFKGDGRFSNSTLSLFAKRSDKFRPDSRSLSPSRVTNDKKHSLSYSQLHEKKKTSRQELNLNTIPDPDDFLRHLPVQYRGSMIAFGQLSDPAVPNEHSPSQADLHNLIKLSDIILSKSVSYTHLTLPTIYSV